MVTGELAPVAGAGETVAHVSAFEVTLFATFRSARGQVVAGDLALVATKARTVVRVVTIELAVIPTYDPA